MNAKSAPAKPGQVVILYGTGLGAGLNADNVPPQAGDLNVPLEIFVGGKPASKYYAGRSPCCSGLDQITLTLPNDVPLGCHVPVQLRTNGSEPSNVVSIAITADGSACSENVQPFGDTTSGMFGSVLLVRASLTRPVAGIPITAVVDEAVATFRNDAVGDFAYNPYFTPPPAGTCTASSAPGDLFSTPTLPGFAPVGKVLNAGTLTVSNGSKQVTVPFGKQQYSKQLGYSLPTPLPSPGGLLDSGPVRIMGAGGTDVGAFSVSVNPAPQINITNLMSSSSVPRSSDLTVTWTVSGSAPSNALIIVAGGTRDSALRNSAAFLCSASANSTSLTVPSAILERLPATTSGVVLAGILQNTPQATFQTSGIKAGSATTASISAVTVSFK